MSQHLLDLQDCHSIYRLLRSLTGQTSRLASHSTHWQSRIHPQLGSPLASRIADSSLLRVTVCQSPAGVPHYAMLGLVIAAGYRIGLWTKRTMKISFDDSEASHPTGNYRIRSNAQCLRLAFYAVNASSFSLSSERGESLDRRRGAARTFSARDSGSLKPRSGEDVWPNSCNGMVIVVLELFFIALASSAAS